MNFGDYWLTDPNHLPAFPLLQPKRDPECHEGMLHAVWGAVRSGIRDSQNTEWWVQAGCNFNFVNSFCGGIYVTALNVRIGRFQPAFAGPDVRAAFDAMPTVTGLFPNWEQQATMLDALRPIVLDYPTSPNGSTQSRLEKLGAVSLGTKLLSICGLYNRAFLGYWDTRRGSTRTFMRWIHDTLAGGIRAPESYEQFWYKRGRELDPGRGIQNDDRMFHAGISCAWPQRMVTGMFMRNRNSGNDVAHSTVYVANRRPTYSDKRMQIPHGAVHVLRARPSIALVERLVNGNFNVAPDYFYPM